MLKRTSIILSFILLLAGICVSEAVAAEFWVWIDWMGEQPDPENLTVSVELDVSGTFEMDYLMTEGGISTYHIFAGNSSDSDWRVITTSNYTWLEGNPTNWVEINHVDENGRPLHLDN